MRRIKFKVVRTSDSFWKDKRAFYVEFEDLDAFIEWCDDQGSVIVSGTDIEIYDDYRE